MVITEKDKHTSLLVSFALRNRETPFVDLIKQYFQEFNKVLQVREAEVRQVPQPEILDIPRGMDYLLIYDNPTEHRYHAFRDREGYLQVVLDEFGNVQVRD